MLMTGRTHRHQRFALRRVGRGDICVTLVARCGLGCFVLVGLVARKALFGMVYLDGRRIALLGEVAASTIARRMRCQRWRMRGIVRQRNAECVATRTIRGRTLAEAGLCLFLRMFNLGLRSVTIGTFRRHDLAYRRLGQLMAFGTRDLFLNDVELMAAHAARDLPLLGYIDALTWGSIGNSVGGAGSDACCRDGHQEQRGQHPFVRQGRAIIGRSSPKNTASDSFQGSCNAGLWRA